jgi:Xaa-Pro aminopeptidase
VTEVEQKRRRLHGVMDAEGLDAIVLRRPGNAAWYSGGGRTHILAVQEAGVAAIVVRRDGDEVVTGVNEAPRLEAEELAALGARFTVLPWNGDVDSALPGGERTGVDGSLPGRRDVSAAVEAARRALTEPELERFRALGRDAAEVMTDVCYAVEPSDTELDAAAILAGALVERGIDPVVLLVAGEQRVPAYRHPLPTTAPLGGLVMLVACARRAGLIASLTRFVAFGPVRPELADSHARLLSVDVAFNAATRPGARVGDVFGAGRSAYAEHGFDADEWRLHHQGGPTGYEPRDYVADDSSDALVEDAQAFAWNPSVRSLKSEDTIVARADGPEILTVDPRWPTSEVDGLARPLVLEREL